MKSIPYKTLLAAVGGALCAALVVFAFLGLSGSGKQASFTDGTLQADGSRLTVELDSNATTGYTWFSDASGNAIVIADQRYEDGDNTDDNGETIVGAPGKTVFTYVGIEEGSTDFTLTYKRSWEDSEPEKTLTFTVNTDQDGKVKSVQGTASDNSEIRL